MPLINELNPDSPDAPDAVGQNTEAGGATEMPIAPIKGSLPRYYLRFASDTNYYVGDAPALLVLIITDAGGVVTVPTSVRAQITDNNGQEIGSDISQVYCDPGVTAVQQTISAVPTFNTAGAMNYRLSVTIDPGGGLPVQTKTLVQPLRIFP